MENKIDMLMRALALGLLLAIFSGCESFLTESDPSNFTEENYYTSPAHAESAVIAIYESLYPIHDDQSWLITEFRTGAANTNFVGGGGRANNQPVRDLEEDSDHPSLSTYWVSHYRGIANANLAISKIPDIEMDEAEKSRLLGEARFLRAYYYYNLVRMFGGVPLITQPVDLNSPDLHPERAPVGDIYGLIVEDLTTADGSGLPLNDESGRVTSGAVKSLLSDVYLTMAGYPLRQGDEYYELARDKAKEVIDSGVYSLFDSYENLHSEATENTGEHIFMVQFDASEHTSNPLQSGILPFRMGISELSNEQGLIFAQQEFVESYQSGDKRRMEREFYFTEYTLEADRSDTVDLGNYHIYKLFDEEAHLNTGRSGLNWQIMRYTDVLFNYAEASNEISGPTQEAYEAVNKIRRRAGIVEYSDLTQSQFKDAIMRERFYEHAFEGKLWYDMVRTRKAFNYTSNEIEEYIGHSFVYGPTLSERDLLFAIPSMEIRNNRNLSQNPGY